MLHHVDHGGDGPAVVMLHAFPLDSGMFDRLVPLVTGAMRVVTVDLPGLGRSPVPTTVASMDQVAADVLEVMNTLAIESATVLGISTGGYAALQLAASAPQRVAALVLGSTTPYRIEPDVPSERLAVADELERTRSTTAVADSADEGLGETAHREQPGLVDQVRRTIAAADPSGVAWMARAIAARHDTAEVLRTFAGPVVLLFGAEDTATPPSRGEDMLSLRGDLPSSLAVLPSTGHLTPLETPQEVAAVLDDLLRGSGTR